MRLIGCPGHGAWFLALPAQHLLLNRFEELPLILCAVTSIRQPDPNKPVAQMNEVTSIDKRTGKMCYHSKVPMNRPPPGDPYQTLLVDPRKGVIELLGSRKPVPACGGGEELAALECGAGLRTSSRSAASIAALDC